MKTQIPVWLVAVVVALVLVCIGYFAMKSVNSGTVGSVQPPGPPPPMPGGAPAGQSAK